jgi:hypothetical protein
VALALGAVATAAAFFTSNDSAGQVFVGVPLMAVAAMQGTSAYLGFASASRCEELQALPPPEEDALERALQHNKLALCDRPTSDLTCGTAHARSVITVRAARPAEPK